MFREQFFYEKQVSHTQPALKNSPKQCNVAIGSFLSKGCGDSEAALFSNLDAVTLSRSIYIYIHYT